jgi:phosphatidylinositol glycan class B
VFTRRFLLLTLALHAVTAWFSAGFHHYDEHFQIFEFLNSKLRPGSTAIADLPWEYARQMRAWALPAFFYPFLKAGMALGWRAPVAWTTFFRMLTGVLAWAASLLLARALTASAERADTRRWIAWGLQLAWFMPYVHVRTSSETYASILFFAALALVMNEIPSARRALLAGVLAGLAFECRFHAGFLVAGLAAWLLVVRRWPLGRLAQYCTGVGAALALGRVADWWGYGSWTWSPLNYFTANLVENKAAQWGTMPWWGYFALTGKTLPPLGLALTAATLAFWWLRPRHVLTWTLLPFFLVHCAVAHKELRFMIPIAWASPAMMALALEDARLRRVRAGLARPWVGRTLLAVNGAGLLALALLPARTEPAFYARLWERYPDRFAYVAVGQDDPFVLAQLQANFFKPAQVERTQLESWDEATRWLQAGESFLLYHEGWALPVAAPAALAACPVEFSSLAGWEARYLPAKIIRSQRVQTVRRCGP